MISHLHPFTFVFIHFFFLSFLVDKENPNFEICSLGFEKAIGCYNAAVQVSLNLNLEFQNFGLVEVVLMMVVAQIGTCCHR